MKIYVPAMPMKELTLRKKPRASIGRPLAHVSFRLMAARGVRARYILVNAKFVSAKTSSTGTMASNLKK